MVTAPLILLAIPSVVIGFATIDALIFGGYFGNSIFVDVLRHRGMAGLAEHFHGPVGMATHAVLTAPFWLLVAGAAVVWIFYVLKPDMPARIAKSLGGVYTMLLNNYYFDRFNQIVFAGGARLIGNGLWKIGDVRLIDGLAVNGSARLVGWVAGISRLLQSGYIYHYAFGMIIGVLALITLFLTFNRAG